MVSRNGEYQLERRYAAKLEVFVGSLSQSQLQEFEQITDTAELRNIASKDVPHPMFVDGIDELLIDVYRNDGEQHLNFNSSEARKRFRAGTDPVLKWLDRIQKSEHKQLAESSASHCMPSRISQDTAQVSDADRPSSVPFLMALVTSHVREEEANRSCVVIYPDGRYRRENSTQAYGGNVRLHAFEGSLNSTQIAELRALLDAAELKDLKSGASCKQAFGEGDFTSLSIPRQLSVQRLRFERCFQVLGNRDKPGGYSGMQYVVAPEEHVLNPVREWLKNNVDKQNLPLLPDSTPTNCDPAH